jgi:hypothetical protein
MPTPRRPGLKFAIALSLAAIDFSSPRADSAQSAQLRWQGVERVVAFADVHGAYTELLTLFRESGIVDAQDRWAAGRTHVVSVGDLLDRGADSRKVMDLLMRLQREAEAADGQLHVVLGNHEAMNVLGDLRYVTAGEFAAYTDLETAAERVDQNFPRGFFGHRAALSPTGTYGKWLLSLPVAIVVNDTLFMHGGLSKALRGMSLQELNLRYRTALSDYLGLYARLEQVKLLQPGDDFYARAQLARDRLAATAAANGGNADPTLSNAIERFNAATNNVLFSDSGPNWYRGNALCNETTEADLLLPLLQQFGVARLVVGHTPTRDLRAVTRFDGRLVKLDAGMNRAVYKGRAVALFLESTGLSVRYAGEPSAVPLQPEGLYVAPSEVDDASVLAALRDGGIAVTGPRGPNELSVTVIHGGRRIPAVFQVRDANAARSEVAAYKLDRLMGLGLVPVTVEREVQGQRGVLQGRPQQWVTQADVQQQALRVAGWCGLDLQLQLLDAFDVLSGNEARSAESMVFDSAEWYLYSTSHEHAFGTSTGLPAHLKTRPPMPGAEIRLRAGALDAAGLQAALGNLVDARGREAILRRRDALLALPAAATMTP